jgi:hypothetical protein
LAPKIITRPKGSEPLPLPPGLLPGTATTVPKQSSTPVTIPGDTKLPPAVPNATIPPVATTIPSKTPTTLPQKEGKLPLPPGLGITVPENAPGLNRSGMGIPKVVTPPKYVTSPDLYEARRDLGQASIDALRAGVKPATVNEVVQGERGAMPGGWRGLLAKTLNFDIIPDQIPFSSKLPGRGDTNISWGKKEFKPVEKLLVGPLTTVDTGRRAAVGAFTESVEFGRKLRGQQQTYKATDYIPVHPQTGMPIAKIGDPVITNVTEVLAAPIPDINKITTAEQAQKATLDISKKIAISEAPSLSDLGKQIKDPTTGFGDIPYLQTGNKWVDRAIGFTGDVFLDPTTYIAGPGALAKEGIESAATKTAAQVALEGAELAAKNAIEEVAPYLARKEAADLAAREAADYAAKIAAAATESAVKTPIIKGVIPESAAIVREAETRAATAAAAATKAAEELAAKEAAAAAADAAALAAKKQVGVAAKAVSQAQTKAPRRIYGGGAKETLANRIRQVREEALIVLADKTSTAAEKATAQVAINALTEDLIGEVATKGYAAISGPAAKQLGIKGGLRIGIPTFPKYTIPLTAPFTDAIGELVAGRRLWFVNTPKGAAIMNRLIPAGAGGLFGEAEIKEMRTAIRQGTAKGALATDYVTMLGLDRAYRGQLNLARKFNGQFLKSLITDGDIKGASAKAGRLVFPTGERTAAEFKSLTKGLSKYLEVPEAQWAARGLAPLSAEQRAVYDAVNEYTDALYRQANSIALALGGKPLPKLDAYFPHVQSAAALEWAARDARAAKKVAVDLGIDPTTLLSGNYLNRSLKEGEIWFGHRLTPKDIEGGVVRFNQIAKDSGKIKFDFFTTDVTEALAKYTENHSRFMTYGQTINELGQTAPVLAQDVRGLPLTEIFGKKPGESELLTLEKRLTNLMSPDKLQAGWAPAQVQDVIDKLTELETKLAGSEILRDEFQQAVMDLDEYIRLTDIAIADGVITPAMGTLLTDEADNFATALANQTKNVRGNFLVTDPKRWKIISKVAEDGYEVLNYKTIPNIAVREEVAGMFQNIKRLDDPWVARQADKLLKEYTQFFKSYATGSEGFHIRNAMGNVFMLVAAGGKPDELSRGLKIYRDWQQATKEGMLLPDFINKYPAAERQAVASALSLSGATGYGQFGEIAAGAGVGKTGITGRTATGLTPFAGRKIPFGGGRVIPGKQFELLKTASEKAFAPFRGLRKLGTAVEESTRFALLYDGVKQGYSPQEAANRVNKYLIDYSDITTLDKNFKAIQPFWMWMSRNLPLQIENMWMNPKAYQIYNSFKRNIQDEEGASPFLPDYLKEQGAFKLPQTPTGVNPLVGAAAGGLLGYGIGGPIGAGIGAITGGGAGQLLSGPNAYLNPQLGFPGAGAPNPLQQATSGDIYELLSGLAAPLRILPELEANKQFFSGAPITKESQSSAANREAQRAYLLSQLLPPASLAGRYLSAIPGTEPKIIRELTGSKLDKELQSLGSLIGSPGFRLYSAQEKNEIRRRYYQLQALKGRAIKDNPNLPG